MCPDPIDRIEELSMQVLDLAKELKRSDHDERIDPLIDHLQKESHNLKEICIELCWLEMQN